MRQPVVLADFHGTGAVSAVVDHKDFLAFWEERVEADVDINST